jgi:predicted aspartyl protease
VDIKPNGATYKEIFIAPLNGKKMLNHPFLLDTGATKTTINKSLLILLGYTNEWIERNKISLSENEKPFMADGRKLNAYGIPAMRITIDEHEILHDGYFITSDEAPKLSFLLGADILSYFDIFFKYSEWRTYYEFRKERTQIPPTRGETFAYESN